jgi:integrase/recombinase XerD
LQEVPFAQLGLKERSNIQRLLRECIDVISPDTLVFSEESNKQAVIRLKKTFIKSLPEYVFNQSHSEGRMAQAATLRPAQIRHLLAVTSATSRHPERDCLVLLLGITCGMRVSEIAQVE